jgi:small GTP-binding protein
MGCCWRRRPDDNTIRLWNAETGECLRTLEGHNGSVYCVAFDPSGRNLASGSNDRTVKLWDVVSGRLLRTLKGHRGPVWSVAFDRAGRTLASGSGDYSIKLWEVTNGRLLHTLEGHGIFVSSVVFDPAGRTLVSGSGDRTIKLWDAASGRLLRTLEGHTGHLCSVAFDPVGRTLASGSYDNTVKLWDPSGGQLMRTFEGHTGWVHQISFLSNGRLVASKGGDSTIRLWRSDTGACLGIVSELTQVNWISGLAAHPHLPLLATVGSDPSAPEDERDRLVHIWELDLAVLLGRPATPTVTYTSAKVVLVGDTGVGKSGLAGVLAGQPFEATESTHGRRVWRFDQREETLPTGERQARDTLLWDLAGQPGYRLVHQLNIDQATVALVLIDARSETDPLGPAEYWARAIDQARAPVPITKFLVVARLDRGGLAVNSEQLRHFAKQYGFAGVFQTSAKTGEGVDALAQAIRKIIPWDKLAVTSSPELFAEIKEFLKEEKQRGDKAVVEEVPALFERFKAARGSHPSDRPEATVEVFRTCVDRLEASGLVEVLLFTALDEASRKSEYVLLQPEYIDAYASAAIMTAREDPRGIGHLPESDVLAGRLRLEKEERLPDAAQERLVLAVVVERLLQRDIALRERLDEGDYLVFPSEYTRMSPYPRRNAPGVAFVFEGATRAIFTSLVVRLAHHRDFAKSDFYRDAACYQTTTAGRCAVVLDEQGPGQGRMTAYFEDNPSPVETKAFLRFVRQHLEAKARPGSVRPHRVYFCRACGYGWDESLIENRLKQGKKNIVCPACDERSPLFDLLLPDDEEVRNEAQRIDADADIARRRQLAATAVEGKKRIGEYDVFLSYNTKDRERVVVLAEALVNLGIRPWLDVWDLVPGRPWQQELNVALKRINSAVVCVGPSGLGPWQDHEVLSFIRQFVNRNVPVIPTLLPGVKGVPELPPLLESFLWVDMREFTPDNTRPLANLVAGILGQRPVDMEPSRLADQVAAILAAPVRAESQTEDDGREIVLPINRDALNDEELQAVRLQAAQLLGIRADRLKLKGTRKGSVKVVLVVKDFQAVSRLFAMVNRGDPSLQEFFQRCQISHEQFNRENQATSEQIREAVAARGQEAGIAEQLMPPLSAPPQDELAKWTGGAKLLTVAVAFTDIVDSTKLCVDLGDASWERIRQQHFSRAVSLIRQRNGFVVKNTGDGILALFHSAVEAVDFAVELHRETGHAAIRVRVGVHVGQVSLDGDDAFGRHVNLAARIMGVAKGDGVIVSARVERDIAHRGEPGAQKLRWKEFPDITFKGFPEPMTLWQVEE